jgi:hypothetical protein
MKLTSQKLKQIIKEELEAVSGEPHPGLPINKHVEDIKNLWKKSGEEEKRGIVSIVGELYKRLSYHTFNPDEDEEIQLDLDS